MHLIPQTMSATVSTVLTSYLKHYWENEAEIVEALNANTLPQSFLTELGNLVAVQRDLALTQARRNAVNAMQTEFAAVIEVKNLDQIGRKINDKSTPKEEREFLRAVWSYSRHYPSKATLDAELQFLTPSHAQRLAGEEAQIQSRYDLTRAEKDIYTRFIEAVKPYLAHSSHGYPLLQKYGQTEANATNLEGLRQRMLDEVATWINKESRSRPSTRFDRLTSLRAALNSHLMTNHSTVMSFEQILRTWEAQRLDGRSNFDEFSSGSILPFNKKRTPCSQLQDLWDIVIPPKASTYIEYR